MKKFEIQLGSGCVQGSNVNDIAASVKLAISSLRKEEQYVSCIFIPRNSNFYFTFNVETVVSQEPTMSKSTLTNRGI